MKIVYHFLNSCKFRIGQRVWHRATGQAGTVTDILEGVWASRPFDPPFPDGNVRVRFDELRLRLDAKTRLHWYNDYEFELRKN